MTNNFKPIFAITNYTTAGLTRIERTRELLNYKKAFEFVSEYLEDGGLIIEWLVRKINKRLSIKPRN